MIPFDFSVPFIKISTSELLFEHYRMALNWGKYDTEVKNYDAIKRNGIFFDFIQRTSNCMDGLYLFEKCLLIYTIMKDQFRKQSAAEIEKLNR